MSQTHPVGWEEHDRHRRSRPNPEGLEAMARALGLPARPIRQRRLGGGIASATHLLTYEKGQAVVLKRYPADNETPALEWERLSFASRADLPAPCPLGLDAEGAWFGAPCLVLARMPGRPDVAPKNLDSYVAQVAATMAQIHEVDIRGLTGALVRPHSVDEWQPPDEVPEGLLTPELAERLLSLILAGRSQLVGTKDCLNHADFHPGNLLWSRGRLTGVVDWSATKVGYRWWELSYFVNEMALLAGPEAPERLRARYEDLVGLRCPDPVLWDAVSLWSAHQWGHLWLVGYREQGRRDLQLPLMRQWVRDRVDRVLRDAGG